MIGLLAFALITTLALIALDQVAKSLKAINAAMRKLSKLDGAQ